VERILGHLGPPRVVAISPDGKKLVFAAGDSQETGEIEERRPTVQRLYVRSMSDNTTRPIPSTEQGSMGQPAFSPDGQSLVFFSNTGRSFASAGVLKRIDVAGGEATTLCELEFPLGMSWTGDDIVQRSKRLDLRSVRHERDTPTHIRGTAARGHACLKQLLAH
jgi:WD40-like Beta Propeller Repeat